jgi:Flp pilus assembly protein TadG
MPGMGQRFFKMSAGASVALEFAILAVPLVLLSLGTMEAGYDFFVQEALNNAVHVAARGVQTGTTQGAPTGANIAAWVAADVCPALGNMLNCGPLYVSVTSVPSGVGQNYYTFINANPPSLVTITSNSNVVCTGAAAQLMILRAYYLSPTFLGMLVPVWSQASPVNPDQRVHVSYAAVGFVNEYFSGGKSGC